MEKYLDPKTRASLVAQMVKRPAMQETQVWSLGQKDPLEKGRATHSSILAWEILWTEEFKGSIQSDTTEQWTHQNKGKKKRKIPYNTDKHP